MGYIAQVMTDRHHIKNMSKNEYMKEYEGYKESISHIEHSAIEGGKFFLIAKFAMCSFTNESEENSIQIKDSDDIKIKITIGYPITYIKKYLRMFLIDASTYHQIELEDEGMISLLKSEFDFEAATPRYYIVIYLRCVFTLKEGAFDISLLCDDPRVKFDLIENIDPYEIVKQQFERINSWDIEELPSSRFNEKYPKWCESINYKYDNLPRKRFIIINEDNSFTAIDNRTGDCWCEDFIYKISTIKYLLK